MIPALKDAPIALLALLCALAWACGEPESDPSGSPQAGGVAFVSSQAAPGGDGSREHPLQTLAQAQEAQAHEIHLLAGTYVLPARWDFTAAASLIGQEEGVTVIAQAGTTLSAQAPVTVQALLLQGGDLTLQGGAWTLEGLSLRGFSGELSVQEAQTLQVEALRLEQGAGLSLRQVDSASLTEVELEGGSQGLLVEGVASLTLQGCAIRDVEGVGLQLRGSSVEARELSVSGVRKRQDGSGGDGVAVLAGGELVMEGGSVLSSGDRGLSLVGGQASLRGVTLRHAERPLVAAAQGAQVELEGCTVGPGDACLFVTEASLSLQGGLVQSCNLGALVSDQSQLTVEGTELRDCAGGHLSLNGADIQATIKGATLAGAQESCLSVSQTQAPVLIEDCEISQCQGQGVGMLLVSEVTVRNNQIHDIEPEPLFEVADGVGLVDSEAVVEGNTIEDTRGRGVGLLRSSGVVAGNTLRRNQGGGVAVVDPHPQQVQVRENTVEGARGVGVLVFTADALVEGNQIRDTALDSQAGLGDGLAFGLDAHVLARGNQIQGNALNGVVFLEGARGEVSGNTLTGNGQYGIREYCGEVANQVTVADDNTLDDNTLGDMLLCQ